MHGKYCTAGCGWSGGEWNLSEVCANPAHREEARGVRIDLELAAKRGRLEERLWRALGGVGPRPGARASTPTWACAGVAL